MQLTVTPLSDAGVDVLPPDIVWDGFVGDFAVSTLPADGGVGGLVARNPIETAVLLLLFTDARVDPTDLRFEHHGDPRGWVGDGFDVDVANSEAALGSRLWLYRRSVLIAKTFGEIEAEVRRALNPLIAQGAAVQIDVSGELLNAQNTIRLGVDIYGRNKRKVYAARFDPLWSRADGL